MADDAPRKAGGKRPAAGDAEAPPSPRRRRAARAAVSHEEVWAFEEMERHRPGPPRLAAEPPLTLLAAAGSPAWAPARSPGSEASEGPAPAARAPAGPARPRPRRMADLCSAGPQAFQGVVVLFYAHEMRGLAEEIASSPLSRGKVVLGNLAWSRFPDSFPNLFIESASFLKFADVAFLASLHDPAVVFEQISLIYSIPRYLARSFRVILPFFPTGTMERIQQPGEVATAKTMARLLSAIPPSATGPTKITMFDVHTLHNQFYFGDSVLVAPGSCSSIAHARLQRLDDLDDVSIAFPDEGAHKRFGGSFGGYPAVICHKIRDGDRRVVRVRDGDARGRHVVIVDDLVQSGGTLLEAARSIKAAGAARVSAFVTHAIFPNDAWRKFVSSDVFEYFWVCNTHPVTEKVRGKKPFEVLSIAPLCAGLLQD